MIMERAQALTRLITQFRYDLIMMYPNRWPVFTPLGIPLAHGLVRRSGQAQTPKLGRSSTSIPLRRRQRRKE
jgi:hypothetical protein